MLKIIFLSFTKKEIKFYHIIEKANEIKKTIAKLFPTEIALLNHEIQSQDYEYI